MHLHSSFSIQKVAELDLTKVTIVAQVTITKSFQTGSVYKKVVEFTEVTPLHVTKHFINVVEVPFLYCQRKYKHDFGHIDTSGRGILLCYDKAHLDTLLNELDFKYNCMLDEMQKDIDAMRENINGDYTYKVCDAK